MDVQPLNLNLYGVAIAILPKKETPHILDVICTSITVNDTNLETFKILEGGEYTYKTECNSTDVADSMLCFARAVNTIEKVVGLQKASIDAYNLEGHNVPYRPVALEVGEDSRNPVNIDFSYMLLFDERFSPHRTNEDIRDSYFKGFLINGEKFETLLDEEKNSVAMNNPFFISHLKEKADKRNVAEGAIKHAQPIRANYLSEYKDFPCEFAMACQRLPKLLRQCTFYRGNFTLYGDYSAKSKALRPNAIDAELIHLKPSFDSGDLDAFNRIKKIAQDAGVEIGKSRNAEKYFAVAAPIGYAKNKRMQKRMPRYSFYHWHDPNDKERFPFKEAFHDGFKKTYKGRYTIKFKFPLDPPSPPFTNPVALMIQDQFQILRGTREPNNIREWPELKQQLSNTASNILTP